ncbi:MAG: hypothetical protein AAF747_07645, partial [Planctomycetota bacterium]
DGCPADAGPRRRQRARRLSMTDFNTDNPLHDDDLLELIEGGLSADREAVLRSALASEPAMLAFVDAARRDRALAASLPQPKAPADLAARALDRFEREAMHADADIAALNSSDLDELSLGDIETPGLRIVDAAPRWNPLRALANLGWAGGSLAGVAAVAMLAVGLGLMFGPVWSPPTTPAPGPRPTFDPGTNTIADASDATGAIDASTPDDGIATGADPIIIAQAEDQPLDAADTTTQVATGPTYFADADRALALLAEGRLAVRVRTRAMDDATDRIDALASADRPRSPGWRVLGNATETLAAAMQPRTMQQPWTFEPTVAAMFSESVQQASLWQSPALPTSILEQPATQSLVIRSEPEPLPVYMADVQADRTALLQLKSALSVGSSQAALFMELPEPIETDAGVSTSAESVLWWQEPRRAWDAGRAAVPVIVEPATR